MTALSALLDELDALRAAIGDSPAFSVVGFEREDEEVLARFDDGGTGVFAECYGLDAAALIVAAVNAVPHLVAALRAVEAVRRALAASIDEAEDLEPHRRPVIDAGVVLDQLGRALAAAVTTEAADQ